MMQRQQRHPAGTFPVCRDCGGEPRHIVGTGSHSREAFDVRRPTGTRHQLECRCGAHTPWLPEVADALAEWRRHYGVLSAPSATRARPLLRLHKEA